MLPLWPSQVCLHIIYVFLQKKKERKKKIPVKCLFTFMYFHISSISATGEGCHKQMEAYLPEIMNGVMNFINDPVSLYIL